MPIIFPPLPANVHAANVAFNARRAAGTKPDLSPTADGMSDGSRPELMRYPHVFYNVDDPGDPRNLVPYAWQIVYSRLGNPTANEVAATTKGDADDVRTVEGERLAQTVRELWKIIQEHERDPEPVTLQLLHIRAADLRAVILRRSPLERSTVIPLAPMPPALLQKREWSLDDFIDALRKALSRG
jgi:hypothetical protein